ncbi:MAG: L,D-transpeptidase [Actinomycetota bacterium]|nr:L,D-transpeptidase [Actinomycetota bacterium]
MPFIEHTSPQFHAKAAVLTVAVMVCLAGFMATVSSARPVAAASVAGTTAYPKAGVILRSKLAAHASPAAASPVVRVFPQFRSDFRPTTLLVLAEAKDAKAVRWLKIALPMRPNGRTGWVKAASVQTRTVRRSIVVDLSSRKLRVLENGRTRFATRVAIGRRGLETPTGSRFYLTATFKPTEQFLGAFAFETSAYSKLSEWPGGGVVGLHGTSMPHLLGKAVSHGCVRMSNAAALVLKRLTPAGTPLKIVA